MKFSGEGSTAAIETDALDNRKPVARRMRRMRRMRQTKG
jgi:hypothetical protein